MADQGSEGLLSPFSDIKDAPLLNRFYQAMSWMWGVGLDF